MKLYYDPSKDELIEAGYLKHLLVSRDCFGNVNLHENLEHLTFIGEVYADPIAINQKIRLSKIINNTPCLIIEGFSTEHQIQEGCRFNVELFNYYSTNLVVSVVKLPHYIDFYTLSGSHYRIEYI